MINFYINKMLLTINIKKELKNNLQDKKEYQNKMEK